MAANNEKPTDNKGKDVKSGNGSQQGLDIEKIVTKQELRGGEEDKKLPE